MRITFSTIILPLQVSWVFKITQRTSIHTKKFCEERRDNMCWMWYFKRGFVCCKTILLSFPPSWPLEICTELPVASHHKAASSHTHIHAYRQESHQFLTQRELMQAYLNCKLHTKELNPEPLVLASSLCPLLLRNEPYILKEWNCVEDKKR